MTGENNPNNHKYPKLDITSIRFLILNDIKQPEFYIPLTGNIFIFFIIELARILYQYSNNLHPFFEGVGALDIFIFPINMLIFWIVYLLIKENRNINRNKFLLYFTIFFYFNFKLLSILSNINDTGRWTAQLFRMFNPIVAISDIIVYFLVFFSILYVWNLFIEIVLYLFSKIKNTFIRIIKTLKNN